MGLDASSATIGLCLLTYDDKKIELEHVEFYKPPKKGDVFEKLQAVRQYIFDMTSTLKPDAVALEEIILWMGGGKKCPVCKRQMGRQSTAKTITTLTSLNRTVGLAVLDKSGKSPNMYNVMSIRHKIKEDKKIPKKEEVPERVAAILGIDFPYKMNKLNNIAKENEDMADAIAVALCHIFVERAPEKKPKKKASKKKKK